MSDQMRTMLPLIEPMMPLTVIKVAAPLSMDEAENIHQQFRGAVGDDRPVIVIGPDTEVIMIEPYRTLARRGWLAIGLATLALLLSILLLLWVLVL